MTSTPFTSGGGKKKEERNHVMLSIANKLKVIKWIEIGENRKNILQDFCTGASTISNIVRSKPKLRKFVGSLQSVNARWRDKKHIEKT